MSRPSTHDDLPDYTRQGHLVAHVPSDYITRYPSLGQHLLAALAEADTLGLVRTPEGRIEIPRTDEELDQSLEQAQRSWDYNLRRYEGVLAGDAKACPDYMRSTVDAWAKDEDRDPIDWTAVSS